MNPLLSCLAGLLLLLWAPLTLAGVDPAEQPDSQQNQQEDAGNGEPADTTGEPAPSDNNDSTAPAPQEKDQATGSTLKEVVLEPMEATYRAKVTRGLSLTGEATRSLTKRDDGRWDYRFDVESFIADISESAVLSYEDNVVTPHRYRYSLEGTFISNQSKKYDFDWERQVVVDRKKNREHDLSGYDLIQDQLTAQLQLWVDLRAGKKHMEYLIVDNGDTDDYQFEVLGEETIETEHFGKVDTIKVWRIRDEDSPRSTHMWFAPQWNHLLVRLEQRNSEGEDFDIYLKKATIQGKAIRP